MNKRFADYNFEPLKKVKIQKNLITNYFSKKVSACPRQSGIQNDEEASSYAINPVVEGDEAALSYPMHSGIDCKEENSGLDSIETKSEINDSSQSSGADPKLQKKSKKFIKTIPENPEEQKNVIIWSEALEPESQPPISNNIITDSFYLKFFVSIYTDMRVYRQSVLSDEDLAIINSFEALQEPSKMLYVNVFKRKSQWINLNSIKCQAIPDVLQAFRDLLAFGLAKTIVPAFLLEDMQETYDFLYCLNIGLLKSLETHLRKVLADTLNADHVEIEVEKPWCRCLYYYAKHSIYRSQIRSIAKRTTQDSDSKKSEKVEAIGEILFFLHRNLKISSPCLLIPEDFPAFIKLENNSVSLFSRLHHAYSFYASPNLLDDFIKNTLKGLEPSTYNISATNFPIYTNYFDMIIAESVSGFSFLLENLDSYKYDSKTKYEIAKGIAEIGLVYDKDVDKFIQEYKNVDNDWKSEYTSAGRWARTLHLSLAFIQKEKDWGLAAKILRHLLSQGFYPTKRGFWWERLVVIMKKHLGKNDTSENLIRLAITDPFLRTGRRLEFENRLNKLYFKSPKIHPNQLFDYSHELYSETHTEANSTYVQGKLKFISSTKLLSVEEYALEQYKTLGWEGYHTENLILTSIYGIFMWDFIFYDQIPYVFQTPYQSFPLDYRSNDFFIKRIDIYNKIISEIKAYEDTSAYFFENYRKNLKKLNAFVNWSLLETLGEDFLKRVIRGLGSCLYNVLKFLSEDYKYYSSGMPDLILSRSTEIKFAEVKSTNDKLSEQQKMWIRLLNHSGCKVEVYHVISVNYNIL